MNEKDQLKHIIEQFGKAVEARDVHCLDEILHPHFRVLMPHLGSGEVMTFTKPMYINLIREERIGGDTTRVEFVNLNCVGNTAAVEVNFISEKMKMHLFLNLLKDEKGSWSIVTDIPFVNPKNL
jgi:hypothetical protein